MPQPPFCYIPGCPKQPTRAINVTHSSTGEKCMRHELCNYHAGAMLVALGSTSKCSEHNEYVHGEASPM